MARDVGVVTDLAGVAADDDGQFHIEILAASVERHQRLARGGAVQPSIISPPCHRASRLDNPEKCT